MRKKIIPLAVLLVVIGVLGFLLSGLNKSSAAAVIGEQAPNFVLKNMDGVEVNLSDYKGKVVVLNFFATWCQPCIDEAPELEAFGAEYKDAELLIIAKGETTKRMEKYISESNSKLHYLLDTKEEVSKDYRVIGQPETFIIDENGVLVEKFSGPTTKKNLIGMIKEIHNSQD